MTREIELDLARLRQAYEAGVQTPSSVVSSILGRISARGDDGIWLSLLPEEAIRERAAALESMDREARERLPLWGVPFAVKDNIDLAGCPTTAACPAFSYLPRASAASVEKLVAAGAIPIGKTNLDQFATGLVGTRTPFTVPVNPSQFIIRDRRIEFRLGSGIGTWSRQFRARHRHGRIGPGPCRILQCRRLEADARPDQHDRAGAGQPLDRLHLDFRLHRERCDAGSPQHRRRGRARSL